MEIRLATLNDIEAVCRLYNEFYAYNASLQPNYCKAAKETGEYPESTITSEGSDMFIAVENGNVVGFIHIREAKTPPFASVAAHNYAEVIDFIVTASHREKKIGSMLMEAAKQWGKARSLDYIELFALANAKEALGFYEKQDFVTVSHTMRREL